MQENSNKAIVVNTLILYVRLVITLVCGLFTTRYVLQALGAVDFGLFSVVASIIVFIGILNTSMLAACNRFIAVSIGENNVYKVNEIFNVTFLIHLSIAVFTVFFIAPIGYYYISNFVNYDGELSRALQVFVISILASAFSFIWIPFNAILMARERFFVFCGADIFFSIGKLLLCYLLLFYDGDRLIAYSYIMALTTIIPGLIFYLYCQKNFPSYIKFRIVKKLSCYKPVLYFSLWTGYGAFVQVGQTQCASLLVNAFFNTLMNTALSVSSYLKSAVTMFTDNLTKSISPQITKSYASGNINRCVSLMVLMSKVSFFAAFIVSTPFIFFPEYIIKFWLNQIPEYSILFTRIIMCTIVVGSFNKGIAEYVFATGNIKLYQICTNSLLLLSVIVGYLVLKFGAAAYWLLYIYLLFEVISVIVRQLILKFEYHFNNLILLKGSYLPSMIMIILTIPVLYLKGLFHPLQAMILIFVYQVICLFMFGLSRNERSRIYSYINTKITKIKHK